MNVVDCIDLDWPGMSAGELLCKSENHLLASCNVECHLREMGVLSPSS